MLELQHIHKYYNPGTVNEMCLFEDFSLPVPWKYNQVRDVRTYIDALSGGSKGYLDEWQKPDWFVPHHSLHDCIRDAEQMQLAEG